MNKMKALRISLLLLILGVVVVSGCKVAQQLAPASEQTVPSEQLVDNGLNDLKEIDSLEDNSDLGLEELEKIDLK